MLNFNKKDIHLRLISEKVKNLLLKMAKKPKQTQPDSLEGIEQALTRTERFIEDNSKVISYVVLGIIVIVLGYLGFNRLYLKPLEEEAANQMFMAEKFFERDSFNLALNGYGTYPGFLQIKEDYGLTKSANLSCYYAGICYLQLGDYENAIDNLDDFKTDDLLIGSAKFSSLGDAYVEIGDLDRAIKAYNRGIDKYKNDFSTPILLKKTGLAYEEAGEYENAVEVYEQIKTEFPDATEARDIDKYIARARQKS